MEELFLICPNESVNKAECVSAYVGYTVFIPFWQVRLAPVLPLPLPARLLPLLPLPHPQVPLPPFPQSAGATNQSQRPLCSNKLPQLINQARQSSLGRRQIHIPWLSRPGQNVESLPTILPPLQPIPIPL
jgi:hypothetical protein